MRPIDRRTFLATSGLALAALATGCSKNKPKAQSINDIVTSVSKGGDGRLTVIQAVQDVPVGDDARISFALLDQVDQARRYTGGTLRLYVARDPDGPILQGPVEAGYHGEGLGEKGVYVSRVKLTSAGSWFVLVLGKPADAPREMFGGTAYMAVTTVPGPARGAKALSVATPTPSDHRGVEPYCTRKPPCSMHKLSLDVALANGKPTVFNIGTPQFCQSRVCGPVVDVVQTVSNEFAGRVNFVHAEVYKDDKDAPAKQILSPAAQAYQLEQEPITYWIKPDGTITERIVGPVDVAEVREHVQSLVG
jgi:hypothetical protein